MATSAITEHWQRLQQRGTDLGAAQGDEQDAGYGGRIQLYERGRIYWHHGTGAHGLWGRLLQRYLGAGGHDVNPATGERELGFPTSDHARTDDGRFERVTFEWGTIDDVSGTTAVRLFGRLYDAWRAEGGALGRLGHPLDDVARVEGGRAAWFERGVLWHAEGSGDVLVGELVPPALGHPAFVNPEQPGALEWMVFDGAVAALDARPGLAAALMRGRLMLVGVGGGAALELTPAAAVTPQGGQRRLAFTIQGHGGGSGGRGVGGRGLTDLVGTVDAGMVRDEMSDGGGGGTATPPQPRRLERRRLYSLAFLTRGLAPRPIAPHCLYARSDWEHFGLAHITDVHVSRRIEEYRAKLRATGVAEADVAQLVNWNDAFRDFIRYANHLHATGRLDVIIATGDLVDYVREIDDHPAGPGNFGFFEALVQGQAPGRDDASPPSEALRVPLFTSLGNHDYREHPYFLGWEPRVGSGDVVGGLVGGLSDLVDGIPLVGDALASALEAGFDGLSSLLRAAPGLGVLEAGDPVDLASGALLDAQWNHAGLNTTQEEALRLMGLALGDDRYGVPRLRPEAAARQVAVSRAMREGTHYYFRRINPTRSYVVPLGAHRLVMLDTRWDEGVVDTLPGALATKLGFGSESEENFLSGSPDSVGARPDELEMLRGALREAGAQGLVIVGMHAPPLNPWHTELPNCFRETVHPTGDAAQVMGFLARNVPGEVVIGLPGGAVAPAPGAAERRPGWTRTGTPYFHSGPVEDLLDYGIAVGQQEALAQLIAGDGAARPATIVCCGHGHTRVEYRLRWNAERGQLETYTDHYLGNPESYYPLRLVEGGEWWKAGTHRRYLVRVRPGAPADGAVQQIRDGRGTIWPDLSEVHVPPYPATLSDAADAAAWWQAHGPLVVQTAALGPCSNTRPTLKVNEHPPGPNFQGFRFMQVIGNTIARVQYVTMPELRGAAFPLPWEGAGVPERPGMPTIHVTDATLVTPVPPVTPGTPVPPPLGPAVVREIIGPGGRVIRDHRHD